MKVSAKTIAAVNQSKHLNRIRHVHPDMIIAPQVLRMLIDEDYIDLETSAGEMRTFLYRPKYEGEFPGVVLFSEIYQVTGSIQRIARQLASHGHTVAAPEIYHEFEALGTGYA